MPPEVPDFELDPVAYEERLEFEVDQQQAASLECLEDASIFVPEDEARQLLCEHIEEYVARTDSDPLLFLTQQFLQTPLRQLRFLLLQNIMKAASVYVQPDSPESEDELEGENAQDPAWTHFIDFTLREQIVKCLMLDEEEWSLEVERQADALIELVEKDHGWDELCRLHEPALEAERRRFELAEFL